MEWRSSSVETLLVGFLLIGFTTAQEDPVIRLFKDPTGNVNLAPFEQWINAYDCMKNHSATCPDKYQLTSVGWVNVTRPDTGDYCNKGCADHTRVVLTCVSLVKQDYKFEDGAKIKDINNTIAQGCASGFTGVALPFSNARMICGSKIITSVSALATLLLISYI